MNELNLEKGDTAYVANKCGVKTVTITGVRTYKNGGKTFFVGGLQEKCSFNEYGSRNFKSWHDAAWCRNPHRLFDDVKQAVKCHKDCLKYS